MKHGLKSVLVVLVGAWLGAGLLGCCPKENATKSAACKTTKSSEECKTCCGGNYSYSGEGSCSCF